MSARPFVDIDIECQIDWQSRRLHTAKTVEERREAWERLKKLHKLRSPERVRQMEEARGLR
jgi:hypothetical protein